MEEDDIVTLILYTFIYLGIDIIFCFLFTFLIIKNKYKYSILNFLKNFDINYIYFCF